LAGYEKVMYVTLTSVEQLVKAAEERKVPISVVYVENQVEETGLGIEDLRGEMKRRIDIMRESIKAGVSKPMISKSGMTQGAAYKVKKNASSGGFVVGPSLSDVIANSLAVAEVNACMGRIVAAPTAGSCGVLPGAVLTVAGIHAKAEDDVCMAFFTAAAIGAVIGTRAMLSGAEGGCQAECGAASAMATSAIVELLGGTPQMVSAACAFALKNILGLVCDPVAGLVEIPCIKRNAMASGNAIIAAEMALAGVEPVLTADDAVDALRDVGKRLPYALKETAMGGCATTKTGKMIGIT
jgi:L-serine dehydratase